jgi:erythritol transport system substrate-binding protein
MKRLLAGTAAAGLALSLSACGASQETAAGAADGEGGGTIAIITVDPSNPYWKAEVDTAEQAAADLGYESYTAAHENDPDEQNTLIETAINDDVDGILLDPAGADESIAAVQKVVDAEIPVVLINAEISETGLASSQIVSNNAQGATVGAEAWAAAMEYGGTYVELFGAPSDNNAQVRSDGYEQVLAQYPDLKKVGTEIANWDRQEGQEKMEALLAKSPDIDGVVAGNDEMALGAVNALEAKGKLDQVKVLGFDGSQDAVNAVRDGDLVATVVQPIVEGTTTAMNQLDSVIRTGETGVSEEKQALDCVLVTKDNADTVQNFVVGE